MRSTLALLGILSLSGCHYYFDDDDDAPADGDDTSDDTSDDGDDGTGDQDAGVIEPDASVGCNPAAILPVGWQPVASVSSGTVTNQPDAEREDTFTTIVDASAGGGAGQAEQPFVYLDLEAQEGAAAVGIDDVASFESVDWDIALKRYVIRSNSGDSGPADKEVATVEAEELREENGVPTNLFGDDDWTGPDCDFRADGPGGPRTRFSNWYTVEGGAFLPRPVLHLVRLGGGRYAEIDVVTYYGDQADPNRSGVYVLHWRRL
jgi:hypothetical protein